LKIIVVAAVFSGLIVGITFAAIQNKSTNDGSLSAEASSTKELDPKNLPLEVLKALPPEELAEIFPEKAEAILNAESAKQITTGGKSSDDPEYLRAALEKLGADPPVDATTKELQDMLAHISESTDLQGK
jgi:hypothetical protein